MFFLCVKTEILNAMNDESFVLKEFDTREKCLRYLCDLKWGKGFRCRKCDHAKFVKGKTWYYRKCQSCKWDESCTSHTLFHRIKFPLPTAFALVSQISRLRKGMSCNQISKQYDINIITAWYFRAKIQVAMSEKRPKNFRSYVRKCIQEKPKDKIKSVTIKVDCSTAGKRKAVISKIRTDVANYKVVKWGKQRWSGMRGKNYKPRESKKCIEIALEFLNSDRCYKTQMFILNMKNWIAGVHHFVSMAYLERYLWEYQYRYDRREYSLIESTSELLERMVNSSHLLIRCVKAK